MIAAAGPRFTIATGDVVHGPKATVKIYRRDFGRPWQALGKRIMPTIGNHDASRSRAGGRNYDAYYDYWEGRGATRSRIGTRTRPWASYDIGTWHFVNLNSNCRVVDCSLTGRQVRWLIRDLRKNHRNPATKCLVAYMHHPLFSTGVPRGRSGDRMLVSNLWEVLYRYRTDIVLTGHQHYYERYRPLNPRGKPDSTGITQFITGTGGAVARSPQGKAERQAANAENSIRALGATFFELGPTGFTSFFRTASGKVRDRAAEETTCHPKTAGKPLRAKRTRRFLQRTARLRRLDRRETRLTRKLRRLRKREHVQARNETAGQDRPSATRRSRVRKRMNATETSLKSVRRTHRRLLDKPLYPKA